VFFSTQVMKIFGIWLQHVYYWLCIVHFPLDSNWIRNGKN